MFDCLTRPEGAGSSLSPLQSSAAMDNHGEYVFSSIVAFSLTDALLFVAEMTNSGALRTLYGIPWQASSSPPTCHMSPESLRPPTVAMAKEGQQHTQRRV